MASLFSKLSKGYKIASPGAGVAVLSFFLPWFLVSCGGAEFSMSGWNLAAGMLVDDGFGSVEYVPGNPIFFIILMAGLTILALAYRSARRGRATRVLDGVGVAALSALALLFTLSAVVSLEQEAEMNGMTVRAQFGLWGVLLGYLASFVGGLANLVQRRARPTALPAPVYSADPRAVEKFNP